MQQVIPCLKPNHFSYRMYMASKFISINVYYQNVIQRYKRKIEKSWYQGRKYRKYNGIFMTHEEKTH